VSEIVRTGYDAIAERYLAWSLENDWPGRRMYLGYLLDALAPGSDVLELGCGAGVPATKALVDAGHRVTAVDLSEAQLELARRHVPEAKLVHADMTDLELAPASFDAVSAFYSLTHVPRVQHSGLLRRIASWLRTNGLLAASFGRTDNPEQIEDDWLGAPMFMSHFDAETSLSLVERAGFEVVRQELVPQVEHGQDGAFLWVLARRL
jgi:cyclopropane fatty-acyl-phospholipid synthase-like methyltransferase